MTKQTLLLSCLLLLSGCAGMPSEYNGAIGYTLNTTQADAVNIAYIEESKVGIKEISKKATKTCAKVLNSKRDNVHFKLLDQKTYKKMVKLPVNIHSAPIPGVTNSGTQTILMQRPSYSDSVKKQLTLTEITAECTLK